MSFISVDIEADGPIPGDYSMVSFGAIVIEDSLSKTFYREICPISDNWVPEALAVSGFTREQTLKFQDPKIAMEEFAEWIKEVSKGRPVFTADNPYDFMFIHWYFHHFTGNNPFGWSGRRIGDLWCGMQKDAYAKWKHLRKTTHTHNALDDAKGNAEAVIAMRDMGLKIGLK